MLETVLNTATNGTAVPAPADGPSPPLSAPSAAEVRTVVVGPPRQDSSANGFTAQARLFGFDVRSIAEQRLFHLRGPLTDDDVALLADRLLVEAVGEWWQLAATGDDDADDGGAAEARGPEDADDDGGGGGDAGGAGVIVVETGLRPGVTDREGAELVRAARELGVPLEAASVGRRLLIDGDLGGDDGRLAELAAQVLHNDVVERWTRGRLGPAFTDRGAVAPGVEVVEISEMGAGELAEVSRQRRLGLSVPEMEAVQKHFVSVGRDPTDAEIETLAQTWSEHCSHKTFRGRISGPGTSIVDGLLATYLRAATEKIAAPWVRSAFVDNAGIVAFDDDYDLAIKAETHNHPSALEPFGGANTGVGGVVRDILGVSAKPIAITDVLCFGPEDLPPGTLPDGVLHPRRVRAGVIAGVGDYGNKIGVPTVAGAIVHDESFTTTPLVFAGCVGILPRGSHPSSPQPGDAIVVLGGAVGRDGVGGATFSSMSMAAATAEVAGSSVQIGDPVVEKGLIDVVVTARDRQLYHAVTDCGAGGLSSAVGEMASVLGADVDLALVPRKYPGLAPWEVWLSEAQERMVLAVPDPAPVLDLAERWQVGAAVIGRFTGTGRLVVRDSATPAAVVDLDVGFLHDGCPRVELRAGAARQPRPARRPVAIEPGRALLALLAHPSIRSNEAVVRTYDHEVLGGTIVRPYGGVGADAPADATVMVPPGTAGDKGLAIGIGVNVVIGRHDAEAMAWAVIDEAVRNVVVAGGDPAQLSLLDNFSWGDPTEEATLAGLVDACRGCHHAAIAHGAPFVSGKDSLNNVFVGPDGQPDPVTPTLVITALGVVPDVAAVPLTGVVEPGDDVWLVGPAGGALGGSHLDEVLGADHGGDLPPADPGASARHHQLHAAITAGLVRSAHDLAEGGLAVAAAEWALGGRLGLSLDPPDPAGPSGPAGVPVEVLFGEGAGRYLVEVAPGDAEHFAGLVPSATRIGTVTSDPVVRIGTELSVAVDDVLAAYAGGTAVTSGDGELEAVFDRKPAKKRFQFGPGSGPGQRPSVLIPIAPGTNRNQELADAFEAAGAATYQVPLEALRDGETKLADHQILGLPGGFSYGDALGAGRLLGLDLTTWFVDQLHEATARSMPVIGICNGFQALVRAGLLPGATRLTDRQSAVALVANRSGAFECRWVHLRPEASGSGSVWLDGLDGVGLLRCPVAHGEGRLVMDEGASSTAAFRYVDAGAHPAGGAYPANPNGSDGDIAGLVDASGLVLGLMPHPEDHVSPRQDPLRGRGGGGGCLQLFRNAVSAVVG